MAANEFGVNLFVKRTFEKVVEIMEKLSKDITQNNVQSPMMTVRSLMGPKTQEEIFESSRKGMKLGPPCRQKNIGKSLGRE